MKFPWKNFSQQNVKFVFYWCFFFVTFLLLNNLLGELSPSSKMIVYLDSIRTNKHSELYFAIFQHNRQSFTGINFDVNLLVMGMDEWEITREVIYYQQNYYDLFTEFLWNRKAFAELNFTGQGDDNQLIYEECLSLPGSF